MSSNGVTKEWGDSPPASPKEVGEVTSERIRHQETVDPRVVPNIIGRGHQGLKDIAAEVLADTGESVFIKYIRPRHLSWGFFGVNSHSRAAVDAACEKIHREEEKFVAAIVSGELRPRIPEIDGGGRDYDRSGGRDYDRSGGRGNDRRGGKGGGKGGRRRSESIDERRGD
jgi:hypothetical protein